MVVVGARARRLFGARFTQLREVDVTGAGELLLERQLDSPGLRIGQVSVLAARRVACA